MHPPSTRQTAYLNGDQLVAVLAQADLLGVGDLAAPVGSGEGTGQIVQIGAVGLVQLGAGVDGLGVDGLGTGEIQRNGVKGGEHADIGPGYAGECDLKNYSKDEPVILTCAYFKNHNSPCVAEVYHDYTVRLSAPFCQGPDGTWFEPAIIGSFNGWSEGVACNDIDPSSLGFSRQEHWSGLPFLSPMHESEK